MRRAIVILCAAGAILAEVIGIALMFERITGSGHWALALMVAVGAPYAAIIWLALTGAEARAFALAVGTAVWAFLALVLFAGLMTLFIGFTMGNRDQVASILLLDAFVLLQIPLGIAAGLGYRKLPADRRTQKVWLSSFAVPFVIAVGVAASLQFGTRYQSSHVASIQRNEETARQAIRRAGECLKAHAERSGTYPPSLTAIGPGGAACLGADLVAGKLPGHRLVYHAGAPDAAGRVHIYALCAEARDFRDTAWRTYVADESGQGPQREVREKMLKPYSCPEGWGDDALRRVKYCLAVYAAAQRRYPASLNEIGSGGTGCLAASPDASSRVSGTTYTYGPVVVAYQPGPKQSDGRITTFELTGEGRVDGRRMNVMVDETGAMHAAKNSKAAREDPPPARLAVRLAEEEAAMKQESAALDAKCEAADAAACLTLAHRAFDANRLPEADGAWGRACAHGNDAGCMLARRRDDYQLFALAHADDRDCRAGNAAACRRLERLGRDLRRCDEHVGDGCFEVALLHARAGNGARAQAMWQQGCNAGHAKSCYFWRPGSDLAGAMRLRDACEAGDAAACSELQRRVERAAKS